MYYEKGEITIYMSQVFLHAKLWIPGDEKSIFTAVIH